jgi:hypothetical protein
MDADLIPDSERWEAERRATASRGQPSNGISLRDSDGIVRKSDILDSSASGFNDDTTASGYFAL